jgi:hypothetical protein
VHEGKFTCSCVVCTHAWPLFAFRTELACLCTVQQIARGSCVTAEMHIKQGTEDMQTSKPGCVGSGRSAAAGGVSARLRVASSYFGMTRAGHGLKTGVVCKT